MRISPYRWPQFCVPSLLRPLLSPYIRWHLGSQEDPKLVSCNEANARISSPQHEPPAKPREARFAVRTSIAQRSRCDPLRLLRKFVLPSSPGEMIPPPGSHAVVAFLLGPRAFISC